MKPVALGSNLVHTVANFAALDKLNSWFSNYEVSSNP